jgi:dipeptidyl aminopeptidase/acylaminoacyl peptidase
MTRCLAVALVLWAVEVHAAPPSAEDVLSRLLDLKEIGSPSISPDGRWVAYTQEGRIWRVPTSGGDPERLTEPEPDPSGITWSPSGKWLAYLTQSAKDQSELWLLPTTMGAPRKLTSFGGEVESYGWSHDGRQIAVVVREAALQASHSTSPNKYTGDPVSLDYKRADLRDVLLHFSEISGLSFILDDDVAGAVTLSFKDLPWDEAFDEILRSKRLSYSVSGPIVRIGRTAAFEAERQGNGSEPTPIVVRSLEYTREGAGLVPPRTSGLCIVDAGLGETRRLDLEGVEPEDLGWSPDDRLIVFSGARVPQPPSSPKRDYDIFTVRADGSAPPESIVVQPGDQDSPIFSPDGREIVYRTAHDPAAGSYSGSDLAIVRLADKASRPLGDPIDRDIGTLRSSSDGQSVLFRLGDAGRIHLAEVSVGSGRVRRLVSGERTVGAWDQARNGTLVVTEGDAYRSPELALVQPSGLRTLVSPNASLKTLTLAHVERLRVRAPDGTPIDSFLVRPAAPVKTPGPTIFWLHGGPTIQATASLVVEWQAFAARGYNVVTPNPRGSTGYGTLHAAAIRGAWGTHDAEDVMAVVDSVVGSGLADPDRLAIGGASYGAWLTNHILTQTARFKAAVSDAGLSNMFSDYGVSDTTAYDEDELGLPWEHPEAWTRMSPWFRVQRVRTPTLILCGKEDVRTPLSQSEQWYYALRRLGVETELLVYPGEGHLDRSRAGHRDRALRELTWFDRFLKEPDAATAPCISAPESGPASPH